MVIKSFSLPETLWEQAIKKAENNAQSLSAVIRLLIEKWLRGEISIEQKKGLIVYIGFDFNRIDHAGHPFLQISKKCQSCGRIYKGSGGAKYCWVCSCAKPAVDTQKHRASKFGLTEHFTAIEWAELCVRYGCRCLCCGEVTNLSPDHVIPLSRGGKNTIDNIQPLCKRCNSIKKDHIVDYR